MRLFIIFIVLIILIGAVVYTRRHKPAQTASVITQPRNSAIPAPPPPNPAPQAALREPIDEFRARITKKPFGIYITPKTSPVQPEKFTGYHTGIDVEYTDKPGVEIPVRAIADGEVIKAGRATGYGGILVIKHAIHNTSVVVIYGHLNPDRLPKVGDHVSAGHLIGILGEGGTTQTDGERKHLHFAVRSDDTLNIRGYVNTKAELSGWQDPLTLF